MGIGSNVVRAGALLGTGLLAGSAFVTLRHYLTTPATLDGRLSGRLTLDRNHGGDVAVWLSGVADATPLVLLHDFYPGASSFEYRGLIPRLAASYQVHAMDWLGYGMSQRPEMHFTGELYARMLRGYLKDVVKRPAILIAHGHAANVAARTASDSPELFAGLALVSPWLAAGMKLDPTLSQLLVRLAEKAQLGIFPYAIMSTRMLLRQRSLRRGDASASEDALDYQQASARQLGAEHAALAMLTGELDLPIQHLFPLLHVPLIIVGGERDQRIAPERFRDLARMRRQTPLVIVPRAGGAVFEDQPVQFIEALRPWLAEAAVHPQRLAHLNDLPSFAPRPREQELAAQRLPVPPVANSLAAAERITPKREPRLPDEPVAVPVLRPLPRQSPARQTRRLARAILEPNVGQKPIDSSVPHLDGQHTKGDSFRQDGSNSGKLHD